MRVDLPPAVTEEHLELMRNDLRLLSKALDEAPGAVLDIQNAVIRNDPLAATAADALACRAPC